jgi:hypothetical protein
MKTIEMSKDHSHRISNTAFQQYKAGSTYKRVPEAAVKSILAAGAGKIVNASVKVSAE